MNKPTVIIKEKKYLVTQISVVLKLNSGSLIYLRLSDKLDSTANKPSNEETITKEFVQQIFEEQEGTFQWLGATIKFILTGYNSFESTTFELVGLVIRKDLITWFNDNDFKNKKQDYLIYQKVKAKNAWPFFSQVLGEKFDKPNQDFIDKINFLFPENGCIWRHKDSENFKFLNKALTFANRHVPEVKGWCAFDADKPLRLILFEQEKRDQTIPTLDQTWVPKSYPFLPNQYNWNYEFKSSCTLSRELSINNGQEPALIQQLVSDGNNGENNQKGKNFQAQNPIRLLFAPGTVTVAGKNIFCHTVTYEFKLPAFGDEPPTITMKLELDYPRESGDNEILSLRLLGNFKKWHLPKDEETEIEVAPTRFNANITNWGIIDEKTQKLKVGAKAVLYTQILSPTYSGKKYSGIYIKHEKNDEMIIDIQPCGVPLVLGSIQKYRQQLEKANITLCSQKLAISVSPHNQKLTGAEAIILDNKQIKLNHEKVISGQAQRAVNFLSKNLKLGSSRIQIKSGQTTINSAVNISTPAPQTPKPNQKAPTATSARTPNQTGAANKPSVNNNLAGRQAPKQVLMKTLDGTTKALQITPETKISNLKKELGYESADVYLTHEGKKLNDKLTVADYPNIQKDSTIEARGRLKGGVNFVSKAIDALDPASPKNLANALEKFSQAFRELRGEADQAVNEAFNKQSGLKYKTKPKQGAGSQPAYYKDGVTYYDPKANKETTLLNVPFETANAAQARQFQAIENDYNNGTLITKPMESYIEDPSLLGKYKDDYDNNNAASKRSLIQEYYEWNSFLKAKPALLDIKNSEEIRKKAGISPSRFQEIWDSSFGSIMECTNFESYYEHSGRRHRNAVQSALEHKPDTTNQIDMSKLF